jgi:SagB-type dehydrogenase family enzyme
MSLIEQLINLDDAKQKVFFYSLFEIERMPDFLYIAQKNFDTNKELFTEAFSEKWWNANFEQLPEITDDKYSEFEKDFDDIFTNFSNNYEKRNKEVKDKTMELRNFLKAGFEGCGTYSDQTKGHAVPPMEKPIPENAKVIELPEASKDVIKKSNIYDCIWERESRRKFTDKEISLEELSYLLWATQGVRKSLYNNKITLRTVASGGARQPFETYLVIYNVTGLEAGIYRYQALTHSLVYLHTEENLSGKVIEASLDQQFAGNCAVCFIWSTIPYRCEWRYTTESKKIIAQDSGHLCQNLYLAAESIECGTCAIGAYDQKKMDELIRLDGVDEFVIYVSPVGRIEK